MSKKPDKINSINGKQKRHSFLRDAGQFITSLERDNIINNSCGEKIAPYRGPPRQEPIEVVAMEPRAKITYIEIRYFDRDYSQKCKLYTPLRNFPELMERINSYCQRMTS